MRLLIQRVSEGAVRVDGEVIGAIGNGFVVFVGIEDADSEATADAMVKKLLGLRIFMDENGKTNLDLAAVGGGLLLISQFTLYADCRKGNRPSFIRAGAPDHASRLFDYFTDRCRTSVANVATGSFGADMKVSLVNDGPFTVWLDSAEICKGKASGAPRQEH